MTRQIWLAGAFAASLLLAATTYHVIARYPIEGTDGWDYVTIDSESRRLYVSHGKQIEVLDADSGKHVGVIADLPGVHGAAIATALKHGFTTNGREDTSTMFDITTLATIKKIPVGKGPDSIYYDERSKRVFTGNHGSDDVTAIDAEKGVVVGTIKNVAAGEQMGTGGDGTVYINSEETDEVIAFNPMTLATTHRFKIEGCHTPTGLAVDAKNNRLFIGCRSRAMVVLDAANGKFIKSFSIGTGIDAAAFDPATGMIFMSTGDGAISVFHQKSANDYEDMGVVPTQASGKTMAYDTKTRKIYVPVAAQEMFPNPDPAKKAGRKNREGSFAVLVVGQ